MAHKGRLWKQWWRLDASHTVRFGGLKLPEAFYCPFQSGISSARYAVSQFPKVYAINLNKEYIRLWRSPTFGGFFDNVYWTFEILSPPDEVPTRVKFGIYHEAIIDTPLFVATYRNSNLLFEWWQFLLISIETLHFLSPDIVVNPYPLRMTLQAAQYDRYNP